MDLLSCKTMGKRRADADSRRFFDEFEKVSVSRLRAHRDHRSGQASGADPVPQRNHKAHRHGPRPFPQWRRVQLLRLPQMRQARPQALSDRRRAALHQMLRCDEHQARDPVRFRPGGAQAGAATSSSTSSSPSSKPTEPLRLHTPASWQGAAKRVYRSRQPHRTYAPPDDHPQAQAARHPANQGQRRPQHNPRLQAHASGAGGHPDLAQVWKARTHERLQQALDKAQVAILKALESDNPQLRITAAKLLLNTKQGRERGFTGFET